jgi:hypothetical protein
MASGHNSDGNLCANSIVQDNSTTVLFQRSAIPFCSGVHGVTRDVLDRRADGFVSREVLTKRRCVLGLRSTRVSVVTRS